VIPRTIRASVRDFETSQPALRPALLLRHCEAADGRQSKRDADAPENSGQNIDAGASREKHRVPGCWWRPHTESVPGGAGWTTRLESASRHSHDRVGLCQIILDKRLSLCPVSLWPPSGRRIARDLCGQSSSKQVSPAQASARLFLTGLLCPKSYRPHPQPRDASV
jgi:hypothetical protein